MNLDRRSFLRAGLAMAGTAALSACTAGTSLVAPTDPVVRGAEAARSATGRVHRHRLTAAPSRVDLGGIDVDTWTYGGALPGKEIRVTAGDRLQVELANGLPADTTIHWHGLALRNDMDGVHPLTQHGIAPRSTFIYDFVAPDPGTHWFHPHTGTQLDRGLYAPLIVEDPREPGDYDHDWVVVLDDWVDGTGKTPDDVLASLRGGMGGGHGGGHGGHQMPGMDGDSGDRGGMGGVSDVLGGDAGDVRYPHYLLNGRVPAAPRTFRANPGEVARIRLINAGSDTAFRVCLGEHRMRVTHTDGFPVVPVETESLLLGMGERYDVLVTLADGVFPLVALAEGKDATALGLVRTGGGRVPAPGVRPRQLGSRPLDAATLRAAESVRLPERAPDVSHVLDLTGGMAAYDWGINGRPFDPEVRTLVRQGQRVRVTFRNSTMMWHPMHVHGHTFQLAGGGPRKDTVIVLPHQSVTCDLQADNPGQWMVHCHNTYHAEVGMSTILGYRA